jgi:hypothetical protein
MIRSEEFGAAESAQVGRRRQQPREREREPLGRGVTDAFYLLAETGPSRYRSIIEVRSASTLC